MNAGSRVSSRSDSPLQGNSSIEIPAQQPGMKVLVVDDEPAACETLVSLLHRISSVQAVFTANDGLEAIEKIVVCRPDVLLLDIDLGGMTGFEVMAAVPDRCHPQVVFVTAHDEYAVQAFEKNAVDYL